MSKDKLSKIRKEYRKFSLNKNEVDQNPINQFKLWFNEVLEADIYNEPTAMTLATCGNDLKPTARIVLLKSYDDNGFVFYTNYNSTKGKQLKENPNASLLFFWDKFQRQIRIQGKVEKISREESESYFNSRPYESRIGAIASDQSSILESREILENKIKELLDKFPKNPPLPDNWGGYILKPNYFEFWQGRENRLHDRIIYDKEDDSWKIKRLYP